MELGSWGWDWERWVGTFYPEDLPEDWRLDYYANEFPVVVIPGTQVPALQGPSLRRWQDELPAAFGFLVELPAGPGSDAGLAQRLVEALAVLRGRLRGLLWTVRGTAPGQLAAFREAGALELAPLHLIGEPQGPEWQAAAHAVGRVWTPEAAADGDIDGPALIDAGLALADLRAAVEQYLGCSRAKVPRLILTGQPPHPERLREARSMLELMGL